MSISEEIAARIEYLLSPEVTWVPHAPSGPNQSCALYDASAHLLTCSRRAQQFSTFTFYWVTERFSPQVDNDGATFAQVIGTLRELEIRAKEMEAQQTYGPETKESIP